MQSWLFRAACWQIVRRRTSLAFTTIFVSLVGTRYWSTKQMIHIQGVQLKGMSGIFHAIIFPKALYMGMASCAISGSTTPSRLGWPKFCKAAVTLLLTLTLTLSSVKTLFQSKYSTPRPTQANRKLQRSYKKWNSSWMVWQHRPPTTSGRLKTYGGTCLIVKLSP